MIFFTLIIAIDLYFVVKAQTHKREGEAHSIITLCLFEKVPRSNEEHACTKSCVAPISRSFPINYALKVVLNR